MPPFLVAAVASHIPEDYLDAPSFVFADRSIEQREIDIEIKELESVRSIYGLLRAKPGALAAFKPAALVKRERRSVGSDCSDCTEYTEETVE